MGSLDFGELEFCRLVGTSVEDESLWRVRENSDLEMGSCFLIKGVCF